MRNFRTAPVVWRLLATSLLASPFVAWSAPVTTTGTSVEKVVLDSQQAAGDLGQRIIAQYKPARTIERFLPPEWWNMSDSQKTGLTKLYASWTQSGQIADQDVEAWILTTDPHEATLVDSFVRSIFRKLLPKRKENLQLKYLMTFLPQLMRKAFEAYQAHERDPRIAVSKIEAARVDDADHTELASIFVWLKSEGFNVEVTTKSPEQIAQQTEEMLKNTDKELIQLVSGVDSIVPAKTRVTRRKRFMDWVRYQLGIVRGMSVVHFELAKDRSPMEKRVEAGIGVVIASVSAYTVFRTVHAMELAGEAVNVWIPMLVSISDKMFFNYFGRATSAFFGQGVTFDFTKRSYKDRNGNIKYRENTFEKNKIFFLLSTFINSLFLRELMMIGTHTQIDLAQWTIDFGITWGAILGAAGSSLRGLFSKFNLQLGIEKLRAQLVNRPWVTLGILTAWNTAWSVVQVGDLYNWGIDVPVPWIGTTVRLNARSILGTFAVVGLLTEQIRDYKGWARRGRILLESVGLRKKVECESLLVIHPEDTAPSSSQP